MVWEYTAYTVSRFQSSYLLNSSYYNVLQWDIIVYFCPFLGLWIYNRSELIYVPHYFEFTLVVYKLAYLSKNLTFPSRGLLSSGLGGGKKVQKVSPWDFGAWRKCWNWNEPFILCCDSYWIITCFLFSLYKVDDCWLIHRANKVNLPVFYFCSNDFSSQNKYSHSNLYCVSYIFVTWLTGRRS